MPNVYDDMRAALDSALAINARVEKELLLVHDLLWRCLEVINEEAETVLAAEVRAYLGCDR